MKKEASENLIFLVAAFFVIIIGLTLAGNFGFNGLTGSSISVKSYGLSAELMETQAGKIQTHIGLSQPDLSNLAETSGRKEAAEKITEAAGFSDSLAGFYENNPPTIIHYLALDAVREAGAELADDFKEDLTCLKNIGENHGRVWKFNIFLITELRYENCINNPDWVFAYAKHTFFGEEGVQYVCSQESSKLFLVQKNTGEVNLNTAAC